MLRLVKQRIASSSDSMVGIRGIKKEKEEISAEKHNS